MALSIHKNVQSKPLQDNFLPHKYPYYRLILILIINWYVQAPQNSYAVLEQFQHACLYQ